MVRFIRPCSHDLICVVLAVRVRPDLTDRGSAVKLPLVADRVEPKAFVEELRPVVFVGGDEYPIGSVPARRLGGGEHDGARDPAPAVLLERVSYTTCESGPLT